MDIPGNYNTTDLSRCHRFAHLVVYSPLISSNLPCQVCRKTWPV